jgi:hypothetical protein
LEPASRRVNAAAALSRPLSAIGIELRTQEIAAVWWAATVAPLPPST